MSSTPGASPVTGARLSRFLLLYCVILTAAVSGCYCSNTSELVRYLFNKYNSNTYVRPVQNESDTLVIQHRMTPRQIIEMDEKSQIITLKGWLSEIWTDENMKWNPADFGNVYEIRLPSDKIWQPDIVLTESVARKVERHFEMDIIVNSEGKVVCMAPVVLEATCPIDPTHFPFDEQHCDLTFTSWSYNGRLLDLVPDPATNTDSFRSSNEWHLTNISVNKDYMHAPCCPEPYPIIIYTLHLRRRSMFYIFNLIFPSFLACILVAVGFILPSDSGERMTLCITSALVEFVFLETVSAYMPPNSQNLPTIQKYLLVSIGIVVFSLVVTAVTLNLHFKGPGCGPVPEWLRHIAFKYIAAIVCVEPNLPNVYRDRLGDKHGHKLRRKDAYKTVQCGLPGIHPQYCGNGTRRVTWFFEGEGHKTESDDDMKFNLNNLQEWREVAKLIDRFYFLMYLLMSLCLIIGFMVAISIGGAGEQPQ